MSVPRPSDILLRVGGRTLHVTGVLAAAGAGRGYVELKETFTRAGVVRRFRDRDGIGRKAAADKVAIEYPGNLSGLVDAAGHPYCGPRLDGARTQLMADPEDFTIWSQNGLVAVTGGQADPFGGSAAFLLDSNTPSGADARFHAVTFTGDGTKVVLVFMRAFSGIQARIALWDNTAGVFRHAVNVNWAGGVPSLATAVGSGTLFPVVSFGGGWYVLAFNADGVVAANTNQIFCYPDNTGGGSANYFFGVNTWNAVFPSSYQGPGESAGAADSLTLPFNFGPGDRTVLIRLARPQHADASGTLGLWPGIFSLSTLNPDLTAFFNNGTRAIVGEIQSGGNFNVIQAILAGAELAIVQQYRNPTTGGQVRQDIGNGFGGFSSSAAAFSTFGNQTLRLGWSLDGGGELYGVLLDLIIARGLFTRAEMLLVP